MEEIFIAQRPETQLSGKSISRIQRCKQKSKYNPGYKKVTVKGCHFIHSKRVYRL